MKSQPRFVELVRVSTDGQAERNTPEIQRTALDKLAKSRPGVRVERIEELGVSGAAALEDRPAIAKLRVLAESKGFDELRVWALDRITRAEDPMDRFAVLSLCRAAGARIVEANGRELDPKDAMGEFQYYVFTWAADQERRRFRARTSAGRARATAAGKYLGGEGAPDGYAWDAEANAWKFDEARAAIVRRIFAESLAGRSTNEIRDGLNAEGISSPHGGRWHQSNLCRTLRHTAYIGRWKRSVAGEAFETKLPPLVDVATFERVGFGLAKRRTRKTNRGAVEALVRAIATCGTCGRRMRVETISSGGKRYAYYICSTLRSKDRCGNSSHRVDKVDPAVWSAVSSRLRDPKLLREAIEAADGSDSDGSTWEAQVKACDKRLRELAKFETEQGRLRRRGLISAEAYESSLSEITVDRDTLTRTRAVAESGIASRTASKRAVQDVQDRLQALGSALDGATFKDRRDLLRALVPPMPGYGVTIHREGRIEIRGALEAPADFSHFHSPVSAGDTKYEGRSSAPLLLRVSYGS